MNNSIGPYHVVTIPLARRIVLNFLELSSWGHYMFGLLEVDVTVARQAMAEYKARTGERLSFTGYLAFCLARAVDEDKSVQAYRKGRKQLVLFDDVDVGLMIERASAGVRAPVGHVLRRANHKSFVEIHEEIRAVQTMPAPSIKKAPALVQWLPLLPGPLLSLLNALIRMGKRLNPAGVWVSMVGTVGVTAVGMFGDGGGWGVAAVEHTLCLIVGGISRKPAVVEGRIEPREILNLTVAFDHDIVDGAPAARFTRRLVELIESGYGLDEFRTPDAVAGDAAAIRLEQIPA